MYGNTLARIDSSRWHRLGGVVLGIAFMPCMACMLPVTSVAAAGSFPPSETIFPATTRAWLSISNPKGLQESFDRTDYGQLLKDQNMKAFVESFRTQMRTSGKQRLGKLGLTLEDFEKIPGGELAVAAIEPEPGTLATVLLVDTTGHEPETRALLETITKRLLEQKATKAAADRTAPSITVFVLPQDATTQATQPRRVVFAVVGSVLVVGDHPATVAQIVNTLPQGRKDSLATLPAFAAVKLRCENQLPADASPVRWFVDPLAYAKVYQAANPPREKRKGPDYVAIIARQGFDAVRGAGGVVLFDDGVYQARHHTLVYAPPLPGREPFASDRFDLAARILEFPNTKSITPLAWVPRGVSSWVAMQWDIQAAFASAESLVDDIVGEKGVFDDVIASLKEDPDGPQIDVEKDLVACLGKQVTLISDFTTPIGTDSERLVIAIETTDPERVAATVAKSMSTDPDMQKIDIAGHVVWELIDRTMAIPTLEVETPGGAVAHADGESDTPVRRNKRRDRDEKLLPHSAVTVANGHLLIASHRDFLERVLAPTGSDESLASAADSTRVAAELQRFFPSTSALRSFARAEESVRPAYEMLKQGAMPKSKSVVGQLLNGILGDGKEGSVRSQKIDGSTLPEFDLIRRYFGTFGLGMESVSEGWYMAGIALSRSQQEPEIARQTPSPVGR